MGAWGALVMGFFAAVFGALTLAWQCRAPGLPAALPFVAFAVIAAAAGRVLRMPGAGIRPMPAAGRAILWSSIGEGIGLLIAANVVANLRRPDLLLPSMALVVGLHVLPIAAAARYRPCLIRGGVLVAAAAAGFALAAPGGGMVSGFAAAAALWVAAVLAIRRDRAARRADAGP